MRKVLVALVIALLVPTVAQASYLSDGKGLVQLMREWEKANAEDKETDYPKAWAFSAYVQGVQDATVVCFGEGPDRVYDAPKPFSLKQLSAAVAKYLNEHPEEWDDHAVDLVIRALRKAFPPK